MIGTNVKQLHSDLLQEVIPESSLDTADGSAYDSSLVQNIDEVYIDGDHLEKEACTVSEVYSCLGKYYKVSQYDLSLEETFNAGITENHSEEMQFNLEKSDIVILDNKDPSLAVLSPASNELLESNSCVKIVPALVPPSGSVKMLHSCGSKVYYGNFSSGGASTESVGTSDNSIDDITNKASSHKMNLDESCVIVDNGELFYVSLSHDVGRQVLQVTKLSFSFYCLLEFYENVPQSR
ncbi:uncharacterized protein LOC110605006 isoform X2 [Manihot esculenta]|nr:uncharacterized protein LOC110605006 isoform X2 [Manihot esculenta]XP_043808262.1 uncharacterized protein LOC110605006 isoform X2 [Manihot esculenta]